MNNESFDDVRENLGLYHCLGRACWGGGGGGDPVGHPFSAVSSRQWRLLADDLSHVLLHWNDESETSNVSLPITSSQWS